MIHWKQPRGVYPNLHARCDLLSNLYLWTIENNLLPSSCTCTLLWFAFKFVSLNYWKQLPPIVQLELKVVICFQICIFELLKTTPLMSLMSIIMLWFAFKFVSLNYWKQPCSWTYPLVHVVICFQICIFELLKTTKQIREIFKNCCDLLSNLYLWTIENNKEQSTPKKEIVVICFQICIFELLKTTPISSSTGCNCCDLLSNLYLWTIENNQPHINKLTQYVVICFQICIFELLKTTPWVYGSLYPKLWFAFKFVSLNYWKQLAVVFPLPPLVVICFQICIFELLKTTGCPELLLRDALWFAFKFVSLNYWKQQKLSPRSHHIVVICFQICIFELLKTTGCRKHYGW